MNEFLFSEFNEVSAKQWKQKIQVDLKGADYHKTLLTQTNEGITIKPFYHSDEVKSIAINSRSMPAKICQEIFISDEKTANRLAKDALKRGAASILFEANKRFAIDLVLGSLGGDLHFKLNFSDQDFIDELLEKTANRTIFIEIDPLGYLVQHGNWFLDQQEDLELLSTALAKVGPSQHVLTIHGGIYQNAGATAVQQIAYILGHLNEYLNEFASELAQKTIAIRVAVGSNYFMEIAKLRALSYLFKKVTDAYEVDIDLHLFAKPSLRNKTLYDYNVNMLRSTTECMSALLGGCDTISNVSYDAIFHKKNEFGERIARNQLLILKEESHFNEASHVADGAYYIENLTVELAEKALRLFKDIEKNGGFLSQLNKGTIQRKIKESAQKEQQQFDAAELVLLGTNAHPNKSDRMNDEIELYPFVKVKKRSTKIEPIIATRLAEKSEQERLAHEQAQE